ncbi:hypothetical protein F8M41_019907 [Gigaspora margarita]|uniref:Peptidase S1 domain-containing protein n=1 Tax=Gigaspora margarita TaxID=4874 RepID=A0A8H4EU56_GIGMA|nr:hypothetical protein F8M41_019907 [Gigaspora margarita]
MVNSILTPILDNYDSSFGRTYIDAKANKVFINTVNSSMIPIVESSPEIKPYINLLSFQNANNSLYHLNHTFNKLIKLAHERKANNVIISINPKINNIVIYLNHKDDKTNKNFTDIAATFYPIMNYSSTTTYKYIGPLIYYSYAPYDFGLIEAIGPDISLTTIINNYPNFYSELLIKDARSITSIGAHVCKSVYTSHATGTCGFVIALNAELVILDRDDNNNYSSSINKEMMLATIHSNSGDSGAPIYTYGLHPLPYVTVVGIEISGNVLFNSVLPLHVIFRHFRLVVVVTP